MVTPCPKHAPSRFPEGVKIHGNVTIGAATSICEPADINGKDSSVIIGEACDVAAFVTINCADSHMRCIEQATEIERQPITIEDHVFIGQGATILGGTSIGHHSVIGAGVVLKHVRVAPYSRVRLAGPLIQPGFYDPGDAA